MHKISKKRSSFPQICILQRLFFPPSPSYFKDGLKTIAHFGTYIEDLSNKLQNIKQKQDEERRRLLELKTLLRSTPDFDRVEVSQITDDVILDRLYDAPLFR